MVSTEKPANLHTYFITINVGIYRLWVCFTKRLEIVPSLFLLRYLFIVLQIVKWEI